MRWLATECMQSVLFAGVDENDCERMLQCFETVQRAYRSGQEVPADHASRSVGIVLSGTLYLSGVDVHGNRAILERLEPGGVFGEVLAFAGAEQTGIAVVCETDSRVVYIGYDHIVKRCENACPCHSRVVENMLRLIADKTLSLSERVEVLSQRTIRDKLLCYFGQTARREGAPHFRLPFSLSALADYLCVDRSAMMRELSRMKREGLLESSRREIVLHPLPMDSRLG